MLAQPNMNKRQLKKNGEAQTAVLEINKDYRKTIKENALKTQKTITERQKDLNKKRVSLYLNLDNHKKILGIQNNHFTQHKKKISKSDAINILLNKI